MKRRKFCPWSFAGALIFAAFSIIGMHFSSFGEKVGGFGNMADLVKYLPVAIILTVFFYFILYFLLNKKICKKAETPDSKLWEFYEKHIFIISFIVLIISWVPYMLCFYPGSVSHDGYKQINQSMGIEPLTNQHPILGTYIIGFFFQIGSMVNDNFGVFLYICFQVIASSAAFALSVSRIRKMGISLKGSALAMTFFAVVPVWGMYEQAVVKDTLYTAVFVWFMVCFLSLADEVLCDKKEKIEKKTILLFLISAFLTCAIRQNGKFIVLPAAVFLTAVSLKKWKSMLAVLVIFLVLLSGYNKVIVPATGAEPISRRATHSVMFQQTAKYLWAYPEEVTEEEYETIDKVIDADTIAEKYNPRLSDPVKDTFNNQTSNENVKEYLKVWYQMFWKHPGVYVEAFLQHCYGYLDPFHISAPVPIFQNYIKGAPIATGDFDIHYTHGKAVRGRLTEYAMLWTRMFPLTLLIYPGVYTWITLFCILLLCKKRKWKQLSVMMIPVFIILTNMASPVNGCLRYTLPLMAVTPLLLAWIIKETRISEERKS